MATSLSKFLKFYVRFTPSYSAIGYYARRLGWKALRPSFEGQTWLVTGGSAGIGGATARIAAAAGATVLAVSRNANLPASASELQSSGGRIIPVSADLSLQEQVVRVAADLQAKGHALDVLVNNVGVMKHAVELTREGVEVSFATSLQNHYLLVKELLNKNVLLDDCTVIEVSSGGMYNHPLVIDEMNNQSESFEAKRAYGLNKRGQVVLTGYWRQKYAGTRRRFYAMHPGWCDTGAVRRDMPTFRKSLKAVLRTGEMGADTIIWLAHNKPDQNELESIWFDRKERDAHIYPQTRVSDYTRDDLVAFLESNTTQLA